MSFLKNVFSPLAVTVLLVGACSQSCVRGQHQRPEFRTYIPFLDKDLKENSGLIRFRGKLWTINDSGGKATLYAIDAKNGKISQKVKLKGAKNRDWEELAQDDQYIYICDVGNNFGSRKKMRVYRVPKDSIPAQGNTGLIPDEIVYRYANQPKDHEKGIRSSFDCEAAFVMRDTLWLLTKDWQTRTATLYPCPLQPGSHMLEPGMEFPVDGLLTAADLSPDGRYLLLLGYKDYVPFIWIWPGINEAFDFSRAVRIDYPGYHQLQSEGIAIEDPSRVYVSNERSRGFPASVYLVDLSAYFAEGE